MQGGFFGGTVSEAKRGNPPPFSQPSQLQRRRLHPLHKLHHVPLLLVEPIHLPTRLETYQQLTNLPHAVKQHEPTHTNPFLLNGTFDRGRTSPRRTGITPVDRYTIHARITAPPPSKNRNPTLRTELKDPAKRRPTRHSQIARAFDAQEPPQARRRLAVNEARAQFITAMIAPGRRPARPPHDPARACTLFPSHNSPLSEQRPGPGNAARTRKQVNELVPREQPQEVEHPVAKNGRLCTNNAQRIRPPRPSMRYQRIRSPAIGSNLPRTAPAINHRFPRGQRMKGRRRPFAADPRGYPNRRGAKPQHSPERFTGRRQRPAVRKLRDEPAHQPTHVHFTAEIPMPPIKTRRFG